MPALDLNRLGQPRGDWQAYPIPDNLVRAFSLYLRRADRACTNYQAVKHAYGCTADTATHGDIAKQIVTLPSDSVDAMLHVPPRFGIAGELYSQVFYDQLARVLKRRGKLFHYTGTPNKLTSGRDVPNEVVKRLRQAGFVAAVNGDGVLAVKQ